MFDILVGIGLCFVAIRYGLAAPKSRQNVMLSGAVGAVISVLMILVGLGLIAWGIMAYL